MLNHNSVGRTVYVFTNITKDDGDYVKVVKSDLIELLETRYDENSEILLREQQGEIYIN